MAATPFEPEVIDNRRSQELAGVDLSHLRFLAQLMDSVFEIPGLRLRFGFDALLGLLPGFGDFATSLVTLFILQEAHRRGVSRLTLARMGFNVLVDWMVGTIPLAGDAFDVYWKSNQRNVALLLEHAEQPAQARRRTFGDWMFLVALIAVLLTVLVGSLTISYFLISTVWRWLFSA